jgi:uncharacterized protein
MEDDVEKRHEELERSECLRLLADETFGRLGVVLDNYPVILPMQFALDGDRVVMRTNPGSKFHFAPLTHVSFEVDHADVDREEGWSVLVQGVAEDITNAIDELSEHARSLTVQTWGQPPTDCWLAIVPRKITGRRITTT